MTCAWLVWVASGAMGNQNRGPPPPMKTRLITGRDQSKMHRAKAAFPNIHTFLSDVSDPNAIATLYEQVTKQFPELNILINNAGIMREINVHDKAGSLEDITREIEINLSGPIRMVIWHLFHWSFHRFIAQPQLRAAID
jgi:short-subunit dehydrogenase involved in D-alanine esterification of teichoic acids